MIPRLSWSNRPTRPSTPRLPDWILLVALGSMYALVLVGVGLWAFGVDPDAVILWWRSR